MGVGRHAYSEKTDPKLVEIEKFCRILADYLGIAYENGDFSRLYLFANPSFLGHLRQEMNPRLQESIISEIAKDMTEHTTEDIEKQLLAARN